MEPDSSQPDDISPAVMRELQRLDDEYGHRGVQRAHRLLAINVEGEDRAVADDEPIRVGSLDPRTLERRGLLPSDDGPMEACAMWGGPPGPSGRLVPHLLHALDAVARQADEADERARSTRDQLVQLDRRARGMEDALRTLLGWFTERGGLHPVGKNQDGTEWGSDPSVETADGDPDMLTAARLISYALRGVDG